MSAAIDGEARRVFLRAALRGGYLTEEARREIIEQLYHHERAMEGHGDGPQYWYKAEVTW